MSRLRSFSGLKWVGSELDEVIRKARDALEEYVEGGGETAVLGPCVEQLNQVRGVLEMLQLRGAVRLADEMQVSARALKEGRAETPREAAEALMLAMIQLPDYLEKLESGGNDIPLVLLPAINDLRASRGVQLLTEADLVVSATAPEPASERKAADDEANRMLRHVAQRVRPSLHKGLLGWFRGAAPEQGLGSLRDVFTELEEHSVGDPVLRGVFRTAHAVTEGLLDKSIDTDNEVKGLVGRVDRVIKQLAAKGVHSAHKVTQQGVLKDLLQHVARSDSSHPIVQAVKADYDLDRAFPSEDELADARQRLFAPNAGALEGMRAAAIKELLPIKDTLDLYMRGSREQTAQLLGLEEPMLRLANTLDMVGLSDQSGRLKGRAGDIKSIGGGEQVDDTLLMRIAGDLLYVESSLENIQGETGGGAHPVPGAAADVPRGEIQSLVNRTLEEAAVEMAKAKEAIVTYMGSPEDMRPLEATPDMFHGVAGALRVISRNEAAEVLDQVRDFIQKVLIKRGVAPEQKVLDSLAEAITGIEYYMEAVGEGRQDTADILNIARAAFARLQQGSKLEVEVELPVPEEEAQPSEGGEIIAEAAPSLLAEVDEEPTVAVEAAPVQPPPQEEIDPEILEIFLEEAREEEPVVRECYKRWRETPGDSEALGTLRRSFHTLKGSGRLVGAMVIGDFAWSVENLLNRLIDQTIEPSSEINGFMDQAVSSLPELINAQEGGRTAQVDTVALMATADALAGKRASLAATPAATVETVVAQTVTEPLAAGEPETGFVVEDSELSEIFETEAREHLETVYAFLAGCEQQPLPCGFHDELVRSLHTLAGSARMIGLDPLAVVAKALEVKASSSLDQGLGADAEFLGYLKEGSSAITLMVDALNDPSVQMPVTEELVARIHAYVPGQAGPAPAPGEKELPTAAELPLAAEGGETELPLELEESGFIVEAPKEEEIAQEEEEEEAISLAELEALSPIPEGLAGDELVAKLPDEEEASLEALEHIESAAEAVEEKEISLETLEEIEPSTEVLEEEITLEALEQIEPTAEFPEEEEISLEALEQIESAAEEEEISLEALEEAEAVAELPVEEEVSLEALEVIEPVAEAPEEAEISLEALDEITTEALEEVEPIVEASEEESPEALEEAATTAEVLEQIQEQFEVEIPAATLAEIEEAVPQSLVEPTRFEEVVADPELVEIFLEEAEDLLDTLDGDLREWELAPDDTELADQLKRSLHTLKGGARLAGIQSVGNLSHAMETLVETMGPGGPGTDQEFRLSLLQRSVDHLSVQLDAAGLGQPLPTADGLIEELQYVASQETEAEAEVEVEVGAEQQVEERPPLVAQVVEPSAPREEELEQISGDPELLEIFLEEARELLDQLDNGLRDWESDPNNNAAPEQLNRNLHTLKGGARMAGIQSIGDVSHGLETLLSGVTAERVKSHPALIPLAQKALDRLSEQVERVSQQKPVPRAADLVAELELQHRIVEGTAEPAEVEEAVEQPQEAIVSQPSEKTAVPEAVKEETVVSLRKVVTPEAVPPVTPQSVQEQIRVRSDLLNRLVNNSGEISIYRARLEQQNTALGFNLGELDQTVSRLRDQLRQMEIETEAQILYRYEQEHEEGAPLDEEKLDPLELDRFSTIQQLSRSLSETVNDLVSIKSLLYDQQKESETLLLQHSRISNDLQDGLLRTRMVPFTQLVPRLRRVVRQTANSLHKKAVLEVIGGEGEMDRSILDRMLAPMEHILRNAASHGIESPEQRRAAGKSETGKVSIYLTREGNDVIITVSDDGAGLNLQAIRRRAEQMGLLESGARIDDDNLMQLVLEPGFSTAKEVTQIAGRGVGTDVLVSEVKQLGGSLEIDSHPGRGTSFSIRLPFTLAITESLLVEMGDDILAVPHPTMEGVVRISSEDLARSYDGSAPFFNYAGHDYSVRYLGHLLGTGAASVPEGRKWLPLLLVRAGEHRVAIQVDRILGNRQVVVKSVGPQLSSVRWISGGTILPDGRVALILDVSALVRMDVVQTMQAEGAKEVLEEERATRVMVVDDSITVRKVTTRLLKRHNMEVTTAKDGVDAVAQLQDMHPDVMLLDIEMPRMDGYELARHMRNSAELSDIPIIMITSRSGEKHRNIALSLGVKRYLGKPYQEADLLDNIYAVLAEVEMEAEA